MGLRRLFGLCVAATGLAVVVSASLHPPMAGCPGSPADMEGVTLTSMMTVDYCFGDSPVSDANEWFLLLNGVGVSAFLGGLSLVAYRRLVSFHRLLLG